MALGNRLRQARRYVFADALELRLTGPRSAIRHYDAEYDAEAGEARQPDLEIVFGQRASLASTSRVDGRYKSVRWRVALGSPSGALRAEIELAGVPRGFGHSLVQGYFVEPLLSLAAARRGLVLVPAAGIATGDRAILLMGRSRSGKSSLSARILADGGQILGDDQVFLDGSSRVWTFPRRMRFYTDLPATAPAAYARLPAALRLGLIARRVLRVATRGFVAPPIRVKPATLAGRDMPGQMRLGAVLLISREPGLRQLAVEKLDTSMAVSLAQELLAAQRWQLSRIEDRAWQLALEETAGREAELLRSSLEGCPGSVVRIPTSWGAARALDALSGRLLVGRAESG